MAKQRLEAELGLNTQEFNKGINQAKSGVSDLASEFLSMGAGLGAATYALRQIANAMLETEQGARVAATATAVFKQMWVELGNLNRFNLANIIMAGKAAKEAAILKEGDREDMLDQKRIQTEINKLLFEAAEQTNDEKKKKMLQEVIRLQEGLMIMMNVDAQQELQNLYAQLAANTENTKVLDAIAKKKAEILDIEGMMVGVRRVQSQITAIENKQLDEQATILEKLKSKNNFDKVLGNIYNTNTIDTTTLKAPKDQIAGATDALQKQRDVLVSLSETFAGYFSDVNMGFQGMVDGMITGIKRMAMELAAKAAFLAVLGLIFPELGILGMGKFGRLLLGDGLGGLLAGAGGGGGGMGHGSMRNYVSTPASGSPRMPEIRIYGKDLKTSLRRN